MFAFVVMLFFVFVAIAICWNLWRYAFNLWKGLSSVVAKPIVVAEPQCITASPVLPEKTEITALPLFIRHLSDTATLLVRFSQRKKAYTAHLIVWAGAKKKRCSDSYFDLGLIEEKGAVEQVIEEAMSMASKQLTELAAKGKRKRRETKLLALETVQTVPELVMRAALAAAPIMEKSTKTPQVVIEENMPETIRLKKFPSVYRGIIKEIGMMKQNKDGREFETFGVRYVTHEGVVEAVFGANLRIALSEANAGVGDMVEILKIGRKTITPGKAPMNLFKVAKLNKSSS